VKNKAIENEFDIINHYFNTAPSTIEGNPIIQSIGDDCAVVKTNPKKLLVLSTDTLIEGVHFPKNTSAKDIASKSLAVNLSDLAAMGAEPAWFTLAITLNKKCSHKWLNSFSKQLHKQARKYGIDLIGGDTTRGKTLSITIQVHGYVNKKPMLRCNAKTNDIILVSGKLGAAALGLKVALSNYKSNHKQNHYLGLTTKQKKKALKQLNSPKPAIKKALFIAKYSDCAIDISDGLLADLGHILEQSQCGAIIDIANIPIANCLSQLNKQKSLLMAMTGGDDYKLCITLSEQAWNQLQHDCGTKNKTGFYPIGQICKDKGIHFLKDNKLVSKIAGIKISNLSTGYNHFCDKG
jgi:thiamine-monophosphate kinase